MTEIADFLRARIAERRALAEAVPRGPWTWAHAESDTGTYDSLSGPDGEVLSSGDADGYKSWVDKHDALDAYLAIAQPEDVIADCDAKLALIDDLLTEKHEVVDGDCWYTCAAATEERDGGETCEDGRRGGPCDCGRDARVNRRLVILAQSFAGHPDHKGEEWTP